MQKISPFLWFDDQAEAAAKFYVSVFKENSKILKIARYTGSGPGPKGSVMTVYFRLAGQDFIALNGGPVFEHSPAFSLVVNCETQREIDYFWKKLSSEPAAERCGWLQDKFGLSWQIVPTFIGEVMGEGATAKADRVMAAVMQMKKLDLAELEAAAAPGAPGPRRKGAPGPKQKR